MFNCAILTGKWVPKYSNLAIIILRDSKAQLAKQANKLVSVHVRAILIAENADL